MAEETKDTPEETKAPAFDEAKMSELIAKNVSTSVKAAMQESSVAQTQQTQQQQVAQPVKEPDAWDEFIGSKVDGKIANAQLRAEIAEDRVDFYSSDDWLVEVDNFLIEDDPIKRRAEKDELRKDVETKFGNLVKSGRGLPRKDILSAVIGEKMKKDRTKYDETVVNKSKKKQQVELDQAKKGVDIASGNISNFTPKDFHDMSHDRLIKEFGEVAF